MGQPKRITKDLFAPELQEEFDGKLNTQSTLPWEQITDKPQLADSHWRSPVATFDDLPPDNNEEEDVRLVLDSNEVYSWDGASWVLIGANDTNVDWEHLQNKPEVFPPSTHNHDDLYFGQEHLDTELGNKAPLVHNHDGAYYKKTEVDATLSGKSDITHNHDAVYTKLDDLRLTNARTPTAHSNSHKSGGSDALTPADIGAAAAGHAHDYSPSNHNHDASYSPLGHDHDGRYNTKSEITGLLGNKVDKGNVLQKDNTVSYAPFSDYHPATKKYVDDQFAGAGTGDMRKGQYDTNDDGKVNAADVADVANEVAWGNVTGKPSSFMPTAHSHTKADLTDFAHSHAPAEVGAEPAFVKKTAFNKDFGSAAETVTEGNDPRLSDARTPKAHTHTKSQITDFSHTHAPAEVGAEPAFIKSSAFNKNFGTVAGTVAQGNHTHPLLAYFHIGPTPPADTSLIWIDTGV